MRDMRAKKARGIATWAVAAAVMALAAGAPARADVKITTGKLPPATVGLPYSQAIDAQGGRQPYMWSIKIGRAHV